MCEILVTIDTIDTIGRQGAEEATWCSGWKQSSGVRSVPVSCLRVRSPLGSLKTFAFLQDFSFFCGVNEASSIFQLDSTLLQDVLFERSKIYTTLFWIAFLWILVWTTCHPCCHHCGQILPRSGQEETVFPMICNNIQPHLWPGELGGGAQHLLLGDVAVIVPAPDNIIHNTHTLALTCPSSWRPSQPCPPPAWTASSH